MSIIDKYGLSEKEVWQIVSEWYENGFYPDILQNAHGFELCEICHYELYTDFTVRDENRGHLAMKPRPKPET